MPLSSVVGASSILRPGVCTSTSRPASPFEGQTIYETDTDTMRVWNGSAWRLFAEVGASINGNVIQVASTAKTNTFSTTSTSYTDVTDLSVTITPSSSTSKMLITAQVNISVSNTNLHSAHIQLAGGNSGTYVGDAASNRVRAAASTQNWQSEFLASAAPISTSIVYLDSPATASATTYKVQMRVSSNTITGFVNQSGFDTDNATYARVPSTITVMEISA